MYIRFCILYKGEHGSLQRHLLLSCQEDLNYKKTFHLIFPPSEKMWITLAIVVVLFALIWAVTGRPKGLPPGPTCYPVIGNVGLFKPTEATQAHRKLRQQYGDFYTLMIFHKPVIFISGFHHIRELLVKHGDVFSERPRVYTSEIIAKRKGTKLT